MTTKTDREIAEAATPGPWVVSHSGFSIDDNNGYGICDKSMNPVDGDPFKNMKFVARFNPAKVLSLLDRIEALEAERDFWKSSEGACNAIKDTAIEALEVEIEQEREARKAMQRDYCRLEANQRCGGFGYGENTMTHVAIKIASQHGWDCFESEGGDDRY